MDSVLLAIDEAGWVKPDSNYMATTGITRYAFKDVGIPGVNPKGDALLLSDSGRLRLIFWTAHSGLDGHASAETSLDDFNILSHWSQGLTTFDSTVDFYREKDNPSVQHRVLFMRWYTPRDLNKKFTAVALFDNHGVLYYRATDEGNRLDSELRVRKIQLNEYIGSIRK